MIIPVNKISFSIQHNSFNWSLAFYIHMWNTHMYPKYTFCIHDDVIKWKLFPRYWPFVRGIHRSPVNSPHKGQWRGALMFTLICARINGWVNNREAGDLRRYRAHYDVIVMIWINKVSQRQPWNHIQEIYFSYVNAEKSDRSHEDVIKWKQFPRYAGNSPVTGE